MIFIAVGTIIFQRPGTVVPKGEQLANNTGDAIRLSRWDAFAMSLRQFLPVDVPMGSAWSPSDKPVDINMRLFRWNRMVQIQPTVFATLFLRLPGWILIPLGVAAITGLLRVSP
jgi:hypothetical protein